MVRGAAGPPRPGASTCLGSRGDGAGVRSQGREECGSLGYVIVMLLAVLAGGLVYWTSMRYSGGADASGSDGSSFLAENGTDDDRESRPRDGAETEGRPASAPGTAYIPVLPTRGSWQSRLGGIMGLVIAIVIAAAATALVLYEAGHIISKLLTDAANGG